MSRRNHTPIALVAAISCTLALSLSGCNSTSSTNSPVAPGGTLIVDSFQTATQVEANGLRVQLRFRVIGGLVELTQAAQTGAANSRVCLSGSCVEELLSPTFSERTCEGVQKMPVANTALGLAAAWLDGDVVGVDFCIDPVGEQTDFETTVTDGRVRSNAIQTVCTPNGACFSG